MGLNAHAIGAFLHATYTEWESGLIGISDVEERRAVLDWLLDDDADDDPRGGGGSDESPTVPPDDRHSDGNGESGR